MQQTQLESLSPCSSQDHTQGRTWSTHLRIHAVPVFEAGCAQGWGIPEMEWATSLAAHTHPSTAALRAEQSLPTAPLSRTNRIHFQAVTTAASPPWLHLQFHSLAGHRICYRPLWEIITVQFVPSDAAKSTQLKNAPHSELQREDLAQQGQAAASLPCNYTLQFLHLFLCRVGWQRSALSINLPFTSCCWSYSFEHDCNYNPVGFPPFFPFTLLVYFCYHHSVPDLPLPLCLLLSCNSYSDRRLYHWYHQALRLYQAIRISCFFPCLNLVWLSPVCS